MEPVKFQAAEDEIELWVMILYYLPFLYLLMVVISVSGGGDDDALFWGTMIPIIGFLVGLFNYRMEFLKGFSPTSGSASPWHLPSGWRATSASSVMWVASKKSYCSSSCRRCTSPWRRHTDKEHRWALGAAYAAPLGTMGILMGLMMGVIMQYGLF